MKRPVYKRVLLKFSGEALNGGNSQTTIDQEVMHYLSKQVGLLNQRGIEVGLVLGGGNLFRGSAMALQGVSRVSGDYMGLLATIINALAVQDVFNSFGIPTDLYTPFMMPAFAERYNASKASKSLSNGRVAIFAGGTGNPYCTTDSAAALRGAELGADMVFKATKVDGVYDKDPAVHEDAKRYDHLTYRQVLEQGLKVMDHGAIAMCEEAQLPIRVFRYSDPQNFEIIARGDGKVGTLVSSEEMKHE